jgi:hypothetical protein
VGRAVAQPDQLQQLVDPLGVLRGPLAVDQRRQQHVLGRGQGGQQVEELEDEAEDLAAQLGQLAVAEVVEAATGDRRRAPVRPIQRAEDVQQRALPRAGRPHDRHQLPG